MPTYQYRVRDDTGGCHHCRRGFERQEPMADSPLSRCPKCGAAVVRVPSAFLIGPSKGALDSRAKNSGFHRLRKVDEGTYEKEY